MRPWKMTYDARPGDTIESDNVELLVDEIRVTLVGTELACRLAQGPATKKRRIIRLEVDEVVKVLADERTSRAFQSALVRAIEGREDPAVCHLDPLAGVGVLSYDGWSYDLALEPSVPMAKPDGPKLNAEDELARLTPPMTGRIAEESRPVRVDGVLHEADG